MCYENITERLMLMVRNSIFKTSSLKAGHIFVLLVSFYSLFTLAAEEVVVEVVYEYTNSNGDIVVAASVPAEYVGNGYIVKDKQGRILEVVPRALNEQERAERERMQEQERLAEIARQEQQEYDNRLIRLYRSSEEIDRQREKRVQQYESEITALNATLRNTEESIAELLALVEKNEEAGIEPPAATRQKLEAVENEKNTITRQISGIRNSIEETNAKAASDMERFEYLQSQP